MKTLTRYGGWLVAAAFLFLLQPDTAYATPQQITDEDINRAVVSELWSDDVTNANLIDVKTHEGVVTLTGQVRRILERDRSDRLAATVKGVRAVVNRIEVEPLVWRKDSALKQNVIRALRLDPATESYEVDPVVRDGHVTLQGSVDSWQEKQQATRVAKSVPGVRSVENELNMYIDYDRMDSEIQQDILKRLEYDVFVNSDLIKVSVKDGQVTLSGTVGSLDEKNRALADAWVSGARSVEGESLDVDWWAHDAMKREHTYVPRSDEELKDAIKDAFLYDPRVLSVVPEVTVDNGLIILTGTVKTLQAKRAAGEDARNVVGVLGVKNHLRVQSASKVQDSVLEARARQALLNHPFINRHRFTVDAHEGWLYLTGTVVSRYAREEAERVLSNLKGAERVVNNVTLLTTWADKTDWELRHDVEDQLFWSPFVDEDEVSVEVDQGVVTLSGTVDSWGERRSAEKNALDAGAEDVENNLSVTTPVYGPHEWFWPY